MIQIFTFIATTCFLWLSSTAPNDIEGAWNTGEENTVISIAKEGEVWLGRIASSDNTQAEINGIVLKKLHWNGDEWEGQIYAAKRKEWYDVEIVPKAEVLEVEVSVGIFSKSLEWKRVVN